MLRCLARGSGHKDKSMGTSGDVGTDKDTHREYSAIDLETLRREVVVETYRAPGPGGQRKNRKETAIRLTHIPTGLTVVASERRSQAMNREIAFERLLKRLNELNRARKPRIGTKPPLGAVRAQREQKGRQSQAKKLRNRIDVSAEMD